MLMSDPKREENRYVNNQVFDITNGLLLRIESKGITMTDLSKKLGITLHHLNKMIEGDRSMTIQMMARIEFHCGGE